MIWEDFYPYVMPSVLGCPVPILNIHIRQAAITFCRKTLCYPMTLDTVLADGVSTSYDLEIPAGFNAVRVIGLGINGIDKSKTLVDPRKGVQLSRSSNAGEFAFTPNASTISIYPARDVGDKIDVDVALEPSITSSTLPSDMFNEYTNEIAMGALGTLMRLPGVVWENQKLGNENLILFNGRCATIAMKISRGRSAAKMRNHKSYF